MVFHVGFKMFCKVVDYVIIMGYDEHHSSSYESGPVASPAFVEQGIKDALEVVPANKLINAVSIPPTSKLYEAIRIFFKSFSPF